MKPTLCLDLKTATMEELTKKRDALAQDLCLTFIAMTALTPDQKLRSEDLEAWRALVDIFDV